MFEIGTCVCYRAEGICRINDIRNESFGASVGEEYYILSPIKDPNSTLYVPVNNPLLVEKMLPLLSADEICKMVEELREERMEWRVESRARNHALRDAINSGDRRLLIILINTVTEKRGELATMGKKLTGGDEGMLKRAKKMLLDEFSYTTDIADEDTLMMVLEGKMRCNPKN